MSSAECVLFIGHLAIAGALAGVVVWRAIRQHVIALCKRSLPICERLMLLCISDVHDAKPFGNTGFIVVPCVTIAVRLEEPQDRI